MIEFFQAEVVPRIAWLGGWTYVILIVFVMVEGPFATILGAAAASMGLLRPLGVFLACAAGNLLGDLMWYGLGALLPRPLLFRLGRLIGLSQEVVRGLEGQVTENVRRLVVTAKLTWLLAQQTFIVVGMARVPLRRWLLPDVAAELLWTGALVTSGGWLVGSISTMKHWMQAATCILYLVTLFALIRFARAFAPALSARAD